MDKGTFFGLLYCLFNFSNLSNLKSTAPLNLYESVVGVDVFILSQGNSGGEGRGCQTHYANTLYSKNKEKRSKHTTAGVRLNLGEPEFERLWSEEIHLWVCDLV